MRRRSISTIVLAAGLAFGGCGGPDGSGSLPEPEIACIGVPQGRCDEAAKVLMGDSDAAAVQVTVRCTATECTDDDGALQVDVLFADGRRVTRPAGYGSPPEGAPGQPPVLGVDPICLGVPFATCQDMARSAVEISPDAGPPRAIARITVRCTGVCTPLKGEGETRVDYADGSTMTSGWGYEGGG